MHAKELKWTVLDLADADENLSESVKLLIFGALEGDEFFDEVMHGEAGSIERPGGDRGR